MEESEDFKVATSRSIPINWEDFPGIVKENAIIDLGTKEEILGSRSPMGITYTSLKPTKGLSPFDPDFDGIFFTGGLTQMRIWSRHRDTYKTLPDKNCCANYIAWQDRELGEEICPTCNTILEFEKEVR